MSSVRICLSFIVQLNLPMQSPLLKGLFLSCHGKFNMNWTFLEVFCLKRPLFPTGDLLIQVLLYNILVTVGKVQATSLFDSSFVQLHFYIIFFLLFLDIVWNKMFYFFLNLIDTKIILLFTQCHIKWITLYYDHLFICVQMWSTL